MLWFFQLYLIFHIDGKIILSAKGRKVSRSPKDEEMEYEWKKRRSSTPEKKKYAILKRF